MSAKMINKPGRNDKCPCGSGKKFKKCHLDKKHEFSQVTSDQMLEEMKAKEHQRREQQGLGKEIISVEHQGKRFVAVGSELHYSGNWNTFHDFLTDYIKRTLGVNWGNNELKKDFKDMHPILQWFHYYCEMKQKKKTGTGKIASAPYTGASYAYLGLAYNIYLLHHNKGVQSELIRRLKLDDIGNFYGAVYETYVAAHFVKAGFDIEFENELDGSSSHCEFTATHKETGRKFSVEAKAIAPKRKGQPNVVTKLNDALKKKANHERVVFIDMNKPANNFDESKKWLEKAQERIRKHEKKPTLNGIQLPKAYVVITNSSYWHNLEGHFNHSSAFREGFLIPNFKDDYKDTVHNLLSAREQHKEIYGLLDSMQKHGNIPSTFDGENPAVAFGDTDEKNPPLIIGHKYLVPSNSGIDVPATLKQVDVDEEKKLAIGLYELENGGSAVLSCPLSDTELEGYKRHPNTFFGKIQPKKGLRGPLEFYDWIYGLYKNTPKEQLLKLMDNYPNQDELQKLTQDELAKLYCEDITATVNSPKKQ